MQRWNGKLLKIGELVAETPIVQGGMGIGISLSGLASAVANAEENFGVNRDDLFVYAITADEAPTRKWRSFGARGRFKPLLRRSSHITIVLREKE